MLRKTTDQVRQVAKLARQGKHRLFMFGDKSADLSADDVKIARDYVAAYWPHLERYHPKDDESLLGMPKPYLVPSYAEDASFDYNELYYWDSYFMVQGLLTKQHKALVMGILENLLTLFERFSIIPNASRMYLMGRSQPPFLTSFIFDLYQKFDPSEEWLARAISIAKDEYAIVWMGVKKPNERLMYEGLSRYYDINYLHDLAEAESGWDMTPRFNRKALDYLPVDLNALLFKYEMDFARAARIYGDKRDATRWEQAADARRRSMNHLMWDKSRGMYYDFNYKTGKRGTVSSLATFFPMWAGMVSEQQAKALVKNLKRFEEKGGLATTDALPLSQQLSLGSMPVQWAYPNGWAPLQYIVIKALERYGYHDDARRLAMKWLKCNVNWYNQHGVFLEKYNVVTPEKPPVKGVYPTQTGFGWTNSVFERFCQDYIDSQTSPHS
jgi:alpha,alpha-trehalase